MCGTSAICLRQEKAVYRKNRDVRLSMGKYVMCAGDSGLRRVRTSVHYVCTGWKGPRCPEYYYGTYETI